MIIKRSFEEGIKEVITHPDIYPRLTADDSPPPEEWEPRPDRIYLVGWDEEPFGVTSFAPKSSIVYNAHFQVIPEYRKSHAIDFAKECIRWLWDNTKAKKIVAEIPEFHQNVIHFGHKVGFVVEGINSKSFLKDGKLHNQIYLGLEYE